jgi:SH3 domain protein
MTSKFSKICLFSILTLLFSNLSWAKQIRYISDDLTIPMRSGTTTSHKILKFLHSGVAVEVKEITEDGKHAWIILTDDSNKLGWIETRLLMKEPSARDQIVSLKKKHTARLEKNKALKADISELKQLNTELQDEVAQLNKRFNNTSNTLEELRESAARPIEIADLNRKLKLEIEAQKTENEQLVHENTILSDENIKEWFMIGGGVSIGSLILGLLITRISWKRKQSWGGDGY